MNCTKCFTNKCTNMEQDNQCCACSELTKKWCKYCTELLYKVLNGAEV